jgi:hypothetical protein
MVNKGRPLITGSIRRMTGIHYAALYVRSGSFATGLRQRPAGPCPLCRRKRK